jgi:outer membrane protein W
MLRADVGGFGIGTASDFTAAVELGALYDINEAWQLKMSFKSLWVDYEEGVEGTSDYFAYDTVNFGPIIGITYKF